MTFGNTAATSPPNGVESNLIDPPSLFPIILAAVVVCSSLTTLFAAARLFTRWMTSTWALEDYLLTLAWALNMAYDYLFLFSGQIGTGRHLWDVQAVDTKNTFDFSWILSLLYCPMIWIAKSALLYQLMHIFAPTRMGFVYWSIHALLWGNLAFYIIAFLVTMFECIPLDKAWNPKIKGGHCIDLQAAYLAAGAVNVVSDFLILLLPMLAIWRLRMSPKQKIGISAVFATGFLAFASSICRLAYSTRFLASRDATYIPAQIGMWTLTEAATIILCTCFPVMPRFAQLMVVLSKPKPSRDNESNPSHPASGTTLDGAATPLGLRLNGSEGWSKRGDAMAPPKKLYIPLEEHEKEKKSRPYHLAGRGGIERTVSIELTSRASPSACL